MGSYTEADLLRIAKRHHNSKRTYLLVNPLQAKHMAVYPSAALDMMRCLGRKLAELPHRPKLLIAFAETATAIGGVAASTLGVDCIYLTTTREELPEEEQLVFFEEHSHAAEQKLFDSGLDKWLEKTSSIILLDDEFSTGKTLMNMLQQLKMKHPAVAQKQIIAASILNRLPKERMEQWEKEGISFVYLLHLPLQSYEEALVKFDIREPETLPSSPWEHRIPVVAVDSPIPDARRGVNISQYQSSIASLIDRIIAELREEISVAKKILVLGTEEFMLPGILLGAQIEQSFPEAEVYSHATTRSPIGISQGKDYPIKEGYAVPSFYDGNRTTYLYNPAHYDLVLVVTDAPSPSRAAVHALAEVLSVHGRAKIYLLEVESCSAPICREM